MKKYHQKFIALTLGIITIGILTSSLSWAGGKAGVVRISDRKQKPVTRQAPQAKQKIRRTSFNQPSVASTIASSLPAGQSCHSCSIDGCPSCNKCSSNPVQDADLFHRLLRRRKRSYRGRSYGSYNCNECDDCCNSCGFLAFLVPHHRLSVIGQGGDVGLINRLFCIFNRCDDCECEYDAKGQKVKKRKEKHIRTGAYSKVYAVNPWHTDSRDGRVYSAKGYGMPMTVPLAPNVEHTYNYGWGVPSSRLTQVSKPPSRTFTPPFPTRRYPVEVPRQERIEFPPFQR